MRLTTALLSLIGLAAAAPAIELDVRSHEPTWTLKDFIRTCDDTQNVCGYSFTIVPSSGDSIPCQFFDYVRRDEPGEGVRSARFSSPSNLQCAPNSPVFVNIGYDKPGNFWVVVPVNTATGKNAFFGYSSTEMVDYNIVKPDHVAKELVIGQFNKRDASPEAGAEPMPEPFAIEKRNHLGTWTIKQLVRNCATGKCDYTFDIQRSDGFSPQDCTLSVPGDNTQSFGSLPCRQNSDWLISWGFNAQYGFAVMTVSNVIGMNPLNAWFGFNNVATTTNFPDAGPSPVAASTPA